MKNVTILLAVLAVLAMSAPALAYTHWNNNDNNNDYHDADNWDNGVPLDGGADNNGYINMPNVADVAEISQTSACYSIHVGGVASGSGNYSGHAKMLDVTGGYTWDLDGGLYVGRNNNNGNATFVQEGGTLDCNASGNGDVFIGYSATATGKYTFKGGTLTISDDLHIAGYSGGVGTFEVIGGGGTITVGDDFQMYINGSKNLNVTVNSTGLTTIAVAGNAQLRGTLTVTDGGGAGPAGTKYVLMTYATSSGTKFVGDIVKPDNWTVEVDVDTDPNTTGDQLGILVTVPEPATMVLLGIGGIGVLIRRKRR